MYVNFPQGGLLNAGNPVTMPYCNKVERLIGMSAGYFGTVIVDVDLHQHRQSGILVRARRSESFRIRDRRTQLFKRKVHGTWHS